MKDGDQLTARVKEMAAGLDGSGEAEAGPSCWKFQVLGLVVIAEEVAANAAPSLFYVGDPGRAPRAHTIAAALRLGLSRGRDMYLDA